MTAIGAFITPEDCPIVIGDLVVSSSVEHPDEADVPTIGSLKHIPPGDDGYKVVATLQKVVICHDRLVVAWTGPAKAAQELLAKLTRLSDPDTASLARVVEEQEDSDTTGRLGLVGVLVTPERTAQVFSTQGRHITIPAPDPPFLGRGGESLRAAVELAIGFETRGKPAAIRAAQAFALNVIGQLMSLEWTSLQPLEEYFGGGYEIAYWDGDRFAKLDDAVHMFYHAHRGARGKVEKVCCDRMIRPTYVGSTLVVYGKSGFDADGNTKRGVDVYAIRAPHADLEITRADASLGKAKFGGARFVCHYIRIPHNNGTFSVFSRIDRGPPLPISIVDAGPDADDFDVVTSEAALEALASEATKHAMAGDTPTAKTTHENPRTRKKEKQRTKEKQRRKRNKHKKA